MPRLLSAAVFALLFVVATTFGAATALAERRVALVIGNSQYKNANLALTNPKNDADDIAAALTSLGFEVIQTTDARKTDIEGALARFGRVAKESDSALFYYAGHAMQHQGRNYLMPIDAELEDDLSLRYHMVSLDDVRDALDRVSGVRIMILDACRNNPLTERLTRTMSRQTRAVMSTRGLARIDKAQGMVIAFATAAEDVALDGNSGRNSPFTGALLRRMQEPGREIRSMFQLVANDVRAETGGRQIPELSISLADDYYINQKDRLIWDRLRDSTDMVELRNFIDRYPYSVHVWAARNRLDVLERGALEREAKARLEYERERARELEEKLKQQQAQFEAERAKQKAEAKEREAAQQRAEAERLRAEREREARESAQRIEEAKRLEAIEAEKRRIAKEQTDRLAEQQRADAARRAKDDEERRARDETARRQPADPSTVAEAERLREEQRAKNIAEAQRRQQIAVREAEEARLRKEEAERLAKLEAERILAKREADAREAARRLAEEQRAKIERTCEKERAKLGGIEGDLKKLTVFAKDSPCEAARSTAADRIAALNVQAETCKHETDLFEIHKGNGSDTRERIVEFQKQITCDQLRPAVVAFLSKQLIRNTQIALREIGCYSGADNGEFNDATRAAVKRFLTRTDRDEAKLNLTPDLLSEIKAQPPGTCPPLTCAAGSVLKGNTCVAESPAKKPSRQAERPRRERTSTREPTPRAPRAEPAPPQRAEAKPAPRALGIGF